MSNNKNRVYWWKKKCIQKRDWILIFSFLFSLCFRLLILFQCRFALNFDEAHYVRLAANFSEQGFSGLLHLYWPPLYPLLISIINFIFANFEFSARMVNILAGSVLILLIYRLTRELFNKNVARLSALLIAFHPVLAYQSTNALTETLFSAVALGGIAAGWNVLKSYKLGFGFVAGLLFGCSYLLRPEGMGFIIVFTGFLIVRMIFKSIPFSQGSKIFAVLLLGFLFISAPYIFYLKSTTGKWTISTKGAVNQQMESAVYFNEGEIKDPFFHLTKDNRHLPYDMALHFGNIRELIQSDEGQKRIVQISFVKYVKKYVRNIHQLLKETIPETVTLLFFVLVTLGFFKESYDSKQGWFIFYLMGYLVFFWLLLVPMFHVNPRYLYPLLPLLFVWIGNGCLFLYEWIQSYLKKNVRLKNSRVNLYNRFSAAMVALIILFGFLPGLLKLVLVTKNDPGMWAEPIELKKAGLWLRENTDHPPVLMSLNKAVDYYAGQFDMKKGASFSYDPVDRNLEYGRNREVEYVVLSSRYLEWFPNLRPLFHLGEKSDGLEMIYEDKMPNGIQTLVYQIK